MLRDVSEATLNLFFLFRIHILIVAYEILVTEETYYYLTSNQIHLHMVDRRSEGSIIFNIYISVKYFFFNVKYFTLGVGYMSERGSGGMYIPSSCAQKLVASGNPFLSSFLGSRSLFGSSSSSSSPGSFFSSRSSVSSSLGSSSSGCSSSSSVET
jgi:hypothetical protein